MSGVELAQNGVWAKPPAARPLATDAASASATVTASASLLQLSPSAQQAARAERAERRAALRQAAIMAESVIRQRRSKATWRALSPAQRCAVDALAVALAYLPLAELISAATACRSFYAAALRVPNLDSTVSHVWCKIDAYDEEAASVGLTQLAASPFRRHVTQLGRAMDDVSCAVNDADLALLKHLPRVRRVVDMTVMAVAVAGEAHAAGSSSSSFPPSLQSASLFFTSVHIDHQDKDVFSPVLRALVGCSQLAELKLFAPDVHSWDGGEVLQWQLGALSQLQQLTQLELVGVPHVHFNDETMGAVKQLTALRKLTLSHPFDEYEHDDIFGVQWLPSLCSEPHRLQQLQELDLGDMWLAADHMGHLSHLPSLAIFEPSILMLDALPGLAHFPHLTRMHLPFQAQINADFNEGEDFDLLGMDGEGYTLAEAFLPHLTCVGLRELRLDESVFSEAEAATLCQMLTQLRILCLDLVGWPSLEPLRHLALLEEFELTPASHAPFAFSLAHLQPMQRLRSLMLLKCNPPLDNSAGAALAPPSKVLPALLTFEST